MDNRHGTVVLRERVGVQSFPPLVTQHTPEQPGDSKSMLPNVFSCQVHKVNPLSGTVSAKAPSCSQTPEKSTQSSWGTHFAVLCLHITLILHTSELPSCSPPCTVSFATKDHPCTLYECAHSDQPASVACTCRQRTSLPIPPPRVRCIRSQGRQQQWLLQYL